MKTKMEMPLVEAALRLAMSYSRAWHFMLIGRLKGRKVQGRWVVTHESVERLVQQPENESL